MPVGGLQMPPKSLLTNQDTSVIQMTAWFLVNQAWLNAQNKYVWLFTCPMPIPIPSDFNMKKIDGAFSQKFP